MQLAHNLLIDEYTSKFSVRIQCYNPHKIQWITRQKTCAFLMVEIEPFMRDMGEQQQSRQEEKEGEGECEF